MYMSKLILNCIFSSLLIFLISCSHGLTNSQPTKAPKSLATTHHSQWKPQVFASHPNWLGLNLDPQPLDQIRDQLEAMEGTPLKSRGESHITLISPPEFEKLQKFVSMTDMELSANRLDIQQTHWQPVCVARATDPKESKRVTYYVVVDSPGLLEIRRELFRLFVKNGGDPADFNLVNYYPHITIGFTQRDLFDTDGIIKDKRYCVFDLVTAQGEKLTKWNQ